MTPAQKPVDPMVISCYKCILEHPVTAVQQASLTGLGCTAQQYPF
ncbi:MAG: hypothetical protein WAW61_01525 [Methylococcaceae bacterium]